MVSLMPSGNLNMNLSDALPVGVVLFFIITFICLYWSYKHTGTVTHINGVTVTQKQLTRRTSRHTVNEVTVT